MEKLDVLIRSAVDEDLLLETTFSDIVERARLAKRRKRLRKSGLMTGSMAATVMCLAAATAPAVPAADFDTPIGFDHASYSADFRLVRRTAPVTPEQLLAATLNIGVSQGFIDCRNGPSRNHEATMITQLPADLSANSVAKVCMDYYTSPEPSSGYVVSTADAVLAEKWRGQEGYLRLPRPASVAICTSEDSPQAIEVFPITSQVERPESLCQDNAMHPLTFEQTAPTRPKFEVADYDAYMLWVARHAPAVNRTTIGFGHSWPMSYWTGATPTLLDVEQLWVRLHGYADARPLHQSEITVPLRLVGEIQSDGSVVTYAEPLPLK